MMISSFRTTMVLLFLASTSLAIGAPEQGLALHLAFDGSLEPTVGKELGTAQAFKNPKFVEGRHGQAIELKDGAYLVQRIPDTIRDGEFTMAFWIKPLWHPQDSLPHPVVDIPNDPKKLDKVGDGPGQFQLKKGWSETIAPNHFYGATDPDIARMHLRPSQWTHVVACFSVKGQFTATYWDGEGSRASAKLSLPAAYGDIVWLGSLQGGAGGGDIVLDDFRIYDRVVTPEEIPAVAGATFPAPFDYFSLGTQCDPSQAVETPHVKWAKPLWGGTLRTLCIAEAPRSRELIELMQRLDMNPLILTAPTFSDSMTKNKEVYERLGRKVEAALKSEKIDCVLVAGFGWNLLPDSTRAAIHAYVRGGGGLVFAEPRCVSMGPTPGIVQTCGAGVWYGWPAGAGDEVNRYARRLDRDDEEYLTQAIPWHALPMFEKLLATRSPDTFFRGGTMDKGRVLLYHVMPAHTFCLTPDGDSFDEFHYDYAIGAVARAVLWASGRGRDLRIRKVTCSDPRHASPYHRIGQPMAWNITIVNNQPTEVRARVSVTGRVPGPEPPSEKTIDVVLKPGDNSFDIPQTPAVFGETFCDIRLLMDGKVADWFTEVVEVKSDELFVDLTADREFYVADQKPRITACVGLITWGDHPGEKGALRWRVYDPYQRLVDRGSQDFEFKSSDQMATEVSWELPPLDEANLSYTLVADLLWKGRLVDQRSLKLLRPRQEVDDFLFTSWDGGGGGAVKSLAALVMRDKYNMDCGTAEFSYGRPVPQSEGQLRRNLDWMSSHNLRSWIYTTHLGGGERGGGHQVADPKQAQELKDRLTTIAKIAAPHSVLYYSLGDETGVGNPKRAATEAEQKDFPLWLKEQYRTLDELNKTWGAQFKDWSEITIPKPEDMDKGLVPFAAVNSYRESLYARAIGIGTAGAHSVDPKARVGVEGVFGLSINWVGQDYWKMTQNSTFLGQYSIGMEMDMVRSLQKPGSLLGGWYNYSKLDRGYSLWGPWQFLLCGAQSFMWYTTLEASHYTALNNDFTPFTQFEWTNEELQPLLNGIGKLVLGMKRDDLGVALLHDQRNLDRIGQPLHSMTMAYTMLRHLGIQTEFIHGDQVAAGELLKRKVKVLWLPYQFSMDPPVAEAVRKFIAGGGAVIADVLPALSNGFRRYDKPLLHDLFAEPATLKGKMPPESAEDLKAWDSHEKVAGKGKTLIFGDCPSTYRRDQWKPRGQFLRGAVAAFLAKCSVKASASARVAEGAFEPLDLVTYHDGDAVYVVVQRNYVVPDPAPRSFDIASASGKAYVYDVRNGKYLGESDRARLPMDAARGGMVAFLPYRAKSIVVEGLPPTCKAGDRLKVRLGLVTEGGKPGRGVFHIETLNPSGSRVAPLCQKVRWSGGVAEIEMPVAYNDPMGKWTLRIRDVATGVQVEKTIEVAAALAAP